MNHIHTLSPSLCPFHHTLLPATHPVPALRHGSTVTVLSADEEKEEEEGADRQTSSQASPVLRD